MLGKLLKYELKATARYFLPLFGAMLVLSMLIRLFGNLFDFGSNWITGLFIFVEVMLIMALVVMALVITIQRFYKNLLGNEGYLMFTLPVSTHHNIFAKLLGATIWNVASGLVIGLSIIIMYWEDSIGSIIGGAWQEFSDVIAYEMGLSPVLLLCEWLPIIFISVAANILFLYLAMAIGQLSNERKFLVSFGAYIGLSTAQSFISFIIIDIIDSLPFTWFRGIYSWVESLTTATQAQLFTLAIVVFTLITGAIYYYFTHWLLNKKLNLT